MLGLFPPDADNPPPHVHMVEDSHEWLCAIAEEGCQTIFDRQMNLVPLGRLHYDQSLAKHGLGHAVWINGCDEEDKDRSLAVVLCSQAGNVESKTECQALQTSLQLETKLLPSGSGPECKTEGAWDG